MKILYIHQYFKTPQQAGGTRSYEFAKYLVDKGHDVIMIAGSKDIKKRVEYKVIDNIKVVYIKNEYSNYMSYKKRMLSFLSFAFWSSIEALKIKKLDLVFATSTPLTVAIPALIVYFFKGIPFAFEVRDLWPEGPIRVGAIRNPLMIRLLLWFERFVYKRARKIVALSPGMVNGIIRAGIEPQKVVMIPNSSDTHRFPMNVQYNGDLLSKYELDKNSFIITYMGAMGLANGLEVVVETCKLLQYELKDKNILVLLVGDGRERPRLEKLKNKYGLNNLLFIDPIPKARIPELLSLSDVGLLVLIPAFDLNSPNKFFDYLAAGKPIISGADGWTQDIIRRNNIGIAVKAGDAKALALAMLEMSRMNKEKLKEMGYRSRKVAEEQYDRMKLAKKFEETLCSALIK
ncbi:MAG: glycosyltransferase WbuB [Thermotoga sp.]|nr:MAG: glycosyltransferase WbuB [Thermotoga sp.]